MSPEQEKAFIKKYNDRIRIDFLDYYIIRFNRDDEILKFKGSVLRRFVYIYRDRKKIECDHTIFSGTDSVEGEDIVYEDYLNAPMYDPRTRSNTKE